MLKSPTPNKLNYSTKTEKSSSLPLLLISHRDHYHISEYLLSTSRDVLGDHAAAILVLFHQAHLLESHWVAGPLGPWGWLGLWSFTQHPCHESEDGSYFMGDLYLSQFTTMISDIVNGFLDVMICWWCFEVIQSYMLLCPEKAVEYCERMPPV